MTGLYLGLAFCLAGLMCIGWVAADRWLDNLLARIERRRAEAQQQADFDTHAEQAIRLATEREPLVLPGPTLADALEDYRLRIVAYTAHIRSFDPEIAEAAEKEAAAIDRQWFDLAHDEAGGAA